MTGLSFSPTDSIDSCGISAFAKPSCAQQAPRTGRAQWFEEKSYFPTGIQTYNFSVPNLVSSKRSRSFCQKCRWQFTAGLVIPVSCTLSQVRSVSCTLFQVRSLYCTFSRVRSGLFRVQCPRSGLSFVRCPSSGQVCLLYTVPGQVYLPYFVPGQCQRALLQFRSLFCTFFRVRLGQFRVHCPR